MPSPFPGMNPFLEAPALWPGVHGRLIIETGKRINQSVPSRYFAEIEERIYLCEADDPASQCVIPDVLVRESLSLPVEYDRPTGPLTMTPPVRVRVSDMEITERQVVIRTIDDQQVVAVIEVLSPANKTSGSQGRNSYLAKRRELLESEIHFIEIDLLRAGLRTQRNPGIPASDYRMTVSRSANRQEVECWPTSLDSPLPVIPVPLIRGDADVLLDLQAVIHQIYDDNNYDRRVNYSGPVPPPELRPESLRWLRECLNARA